jgi:hypothetical protein
VSETFQTVSPRTQVNNCPSYSSDADLREAALLIYAMVVLSLLVPDDDPARRTYSLVLQGSRVPVRRNRSLGICV